VTIHHIDVQPIDTGGFEFGNLLAQAGEISRKQGGRENPMDWA